IGVKDVKSPSKKGIIMKVTVITATLNSIKTIEDTFNSIILQEGYIKEWIIVDGGSSDGTLGFVRSVKSKCCFDIKVFERDPKGVYEAINYGISLGIGEIVAILHSDDYWRADTLSQVIRDFENGWQLVYGRISEISQTGEYISTHGDSSYSKFKKFRLHNIHPSVFVSKSLYDNYGLFNVKYPINSDMDFLMRIVGKGVSIKFNEDIVVCYRKGGISSMRRPKIISIIEICIRNKVGFHGLIYQLMRELYGRLRKWMYR
ncbi:MAG: hypothetical protein A0129_15030, partial [Limnobacter sp. CACIAM 66H1]|uniref:glycosyltransferase n=1 Tax=Limnobacter sp. CACIAM 66H1 TaxID=1813033 RepID=UPI0007A84637